MEEHGSRGEVFVIKRGVVDPDTAIERVLRVELTPLTAPLGDLRRAHSSMSSDSIILERQEPEEVITIRRGECFVEIPTDMIEMVSSYLVDFVALTPPK